MKQAEINCENEKWKEIIMENSIRLPPKLCQKQICGNLNGIRFLFLIDFNTVNDISSRTVIYYFGI